MSAPRALSPAAIAAAERIRTLSVPVCGPNAEYWDRDSKAELLCQQIVQDALDDSGQRIECVEQFVAVFQAADRRVAIEVERGVFEARTALAIMHEFRSSMIQVAPSLCDPLIPRFTEGACRALAQR